MRASIARSAPFYLLQLAPPAETTHFVPVAQMERSSAQPWRHETSVPSVSQRFVVSPRTPPPQIAAGSFDSAQKTVTLEKVTHAFAHGAWSTTNPSRQVSFVPPSHRSPLPPPHAGDGSLESAQNASFFSTECMHAEAHFPKSAPPVHAPPWHVCGTPASQRVMPGVSHSSANERSPGATGPTEQPRKKTASKLANVMRMTPCTATSGPRRATCARAAEAT